MGSTRASATLGRYPMVTQPGRVISWGELRVGARQAFEEAGFAQVHQPTTRRMVMRIDFDDDRRTRDA